MLVHVGDVDQRLGQALNYAGQFLEGLARALEAGRQTQRGEDTVTGGGVDGVDDVTGLLTTEHVAAREHLL